MAIRISLVIVFCALACSLLGAPAHAQTTYLYDYSVITNMDDATGVSISDLIQASDGNLYGTTVHGGGPTGDGTIFKATLDGTVTTLHEFCLTGGNNCTDGYNANWGLIQATDGNIYGSTQKGGTEDSGTVWQITPAGEFKTIYTFCITAGCPDGYWPKLLVQSNNVLSGGPITFYGLTNYGGAYGEGTIFSLTPAGKLTTLYSFCAEGAPACPDGYSAGAPLNQVGNLFYGVMTLGGVNQPQANDGGTLYSVTPSGALKTLYSFCSNFAPGQCYDGNEPSDGLMVTGANTLVGVTEYGGAYGPGAIYQFDTANNTEKVLYSFCADMSACSDGQQPFSLIYTTAGTYVTTYAGGNDNSAGTLLLAPQGSAAGKVVYTFCGSDGIQCADGSFPGGAPIQGSDGNLYGYTTEGGANYNGVLYKIALTPAAPPSIAVTLSPASVSTGSTFSLQYSDFLAASASWATCFATNTASDKTWAGPITGTVATKEVSLTAPGTAGTYTYTLTCGGTETGLATLTVTAGGGKKSSTTALTASPNPASVGQTVTLKATVSGSGGTPTGKITYSVESIDIGSATLSSGVGSLSASSNGQAPGGYPIIATYGGDSNYNGSASPAVTVILNKAATATALTASPNPVTPPASVTLMATVNRTASGSTGSPSGTVTFYYGPVALGTVNLKSGKAALTAGTSGVPAGSYGITAKYNGDTGDSGSTSPAVKVTVN